MPPDPDDLAAAAVDGTDPGALSTEDRATLDAFRRVVAVGRTLDPSDAATDDAPPEVWERIAAAIHRGDGGISVLPDQPEPSDDDGPAAGAAPVVPLESRRRRTARLLAAAAAVVVVLAGITVVALDRERDSGTELVASAELTLLDGGGSGRAELVRRDDGLHLVVDVADLTPAERADFFELWLLTRDGTEPRSLTTFERRDGVVDVIVPGGIDIEEFPVVDISEELDDGDAGHSGKSILRGTLQ